MAQELYISKITLPSGNSYDIKDTWAREQITNGVGFTIAWDGTSTPDITKIPAGVVVTYNQTEYTGTLAAENAQISDALITLIPSMFLILGPLDPSSRCFRLTRRCTLSDFQRPPKC